MSSKIWLNALNVYTWGYTQTYLLYHSLGGQMCSYHLCLSEYFNPITCFHLGMYFQSIPRMWYHRRWHNRGTPAQLSHAAHYGNQPGFSGSECDLHSSHIATAQWCPSSKEVDEEALWENKELPSLCPSPYPFASAGVCILLRGRWDQSWSIQYRTCMVGSAENNSKIECRNFRNIIFLKKKFNTREKRMLGNIPRISICWTLFFQKN
jgi:hypothetical protein